MFHRVVGPITCCLLLSWAVLAAPRKGDSPPAYYFPSKAGDKLVYDVTDGRQSWEWILEVTEARQKGTAVLVTLRGTEGGQRVPVPHQYEVSDKGVYLVAEGDFVLKLPECILSLPFQKGEAWETTYTTRDGDTIKTKRTSADEEDVEVPAGKLRCVRIKSEWVVQGVTYTRTRWDAPRYGMVKEFVVGKDNVRADYVRTTVLKSFTPGGK
jgi:hypothetical protein